MGDAALPERGALDTSTPVKSKTFSHSVVYGVLFASKILNACSWAAANIVVCVSVSSS